MHLPKDVRIIEVGPRDGLQNEPNHVVTKIKIAFIEKLAAAGLTTIEATSFVSPKKIPQLADHSAVMRNLNKLDNVQYPVLVPNMIGFNNAIAVGVTDIAVFASASETFCQRNINCSIEQSLQRFMAVLTAAKQQNIRVRGYISCTLGCPYEGEIAMDTVASLAQWLFEQGCYEISLGDTIGTGTPLKAQQLIDAVSQKIPLAAIAMHFHDTYGQALANILASLQKGIQAIDASVTGLGGCPYAAGAAGNVATEEVVYMLHGLGIATGIDYDKLLKAGKFICDHLQREPVSKAAKAYFARKTV